MSSRNPTTIAMGTTVLGTQVPLQRYYDHSINKEVNAVFHQDYRHVWMTNMPSTLYAYPRQAGNRQDDGTCYYDRHFSWGSARDEWPDLCFQYLPDYSKRSSTKPGQLFTQEGWLVIDLYRKPIYDFRMPLALSSKTESFLLEAILRDNYDLGIQVQDLRARMPGDKRNDGIRSATLSMQMSRWRANAGCISWSPGKTGSDAMKHYLDALLPQECIDANSTREFRDLYPFEVQEMTLLNAGKFPQKARIGTKDFSEKNRQKKVAEALKKYEKLRFAHDGSEELTEAYHKAVALRAERTGRQDEGNDIGDLVSIDGNNAEDSDHEKEYPPAKRRRTHRQVSNAGPRLDARHVPNDSEGEEEYFPFRQSNRLVSNAEHRLNARYILDDSEDEEEYVPIHEISLPAINAPPRRDARHAAFLQNPYIEAEYSSDDSEDYGPVPEDDSRFFRNYRLHEDRKAARKAARQKADDQAQFQSPCHIGDSNQKMDVQAAGQSQWYPSKGHSQSNQNLDGRVHSQSPVYPKESKSQFQPSWHIEDSNQNMDGQTQDEFSWLAEDAEALCRSPWHIEDNNQDMDAQNQSQSQWYPEEGTSECRSPWIIEDSNQTMDGQVESQSPWFIEESKSECRSPGSIGGDELGPETWAERMNPHKSQIPSIDFRTLFPTTAEHIELTQLFLAPSRHHFNLLTGNDPPSVDHNASYKVQYEQYQKALDQFMREFVPEGEGIQLIGLLELSDLGYQWNMPWHEESMGEAVDMAYAQSCAFVIKMNLGRFRKNT